MEEKAKAPFLKPALIYGAILGFVGILLSVILYLLNKQFEGWAGLVSFVITIAILVYCLRAYRDEYLGGYASYGKLLQMTLAIALVSTLLSTLYTVVLINIIDPGYIEKLKQFQIEKISQNPRFEPHLDMIMDRLESRFSNTKLILQALIGGIVVSFIIGLIASAFIKKEENLTGDVA